MTYSVDTYQTLHQIVCAICRSTSYPVPTDSAASTDTTHSRMIQAMNESALEIMQDGYLSELIAEGSVSVVAAVPGDSTVELSLPADFQAMVPGSWFSEDRIRSVAPITDAAAAMLVAGSTSTDVMYFNLARKKIIFYFPPSVAVDVQFKYLSRCHVTDQDVPTLYKDVASKNGDILNIDKSLLLAASRLKYLGWAGLDTRFAAAEYERALGRLGNAVVAPTLSLMGVAGDPAEKAYYGVHLG